MKITKQNWTYIGIGTVAAAALFLAWYYSPTQRDKRAEKKLGTKINKFPGTENLKMTQADADKIASIIMGLSRGVAAPTTEQQKEIANLTKQLSDAGYGLDKNGKAVLKGKSDEPIQNHTAPVTMTGTYKLLKDYKVDVFNSANPKLPLSHVFKKGDFIRGKSYDGGKHISTTADGNIPEDGKVGQPVFKIVISALELSNSIRTK